jgi:hypothetical protein
MDSYLHSYLHLYLRLLHLHPHSPASKVPILSSTVPIVDSKPRYLHLPPLDLNPIRTGGPGRISPQESRKRQENDGSHGGTVSWGTVSRPPASDLIMIAVLCAPMETQGLRHPTHPRICRRASTPPAPRPPPHPGTRSTRPPSRPPPVRPPARATFWVLKSTRMEGRAAGAACRGWPPLDGGGSARARNRRSGPRLPRRGRRREAAGRFRRLGRRCAARLRGGRARGRGLARSSLSMGDGCDPAAHRSAIGLLASNPPRGSVDDCRWAWW